MQWAMWLMAGPCSWLFLGHSHMFVQLELQTWLQTDSTKQDATCRAPPPEQRRQRLADHAARRQQQEVRNAQEHQACTTTKAKILVANPC